MTEKLTKYPHRLLVMVAVEDVDLANKAFAKFTGKADDAKTFTSQLVNSSGIITNYIAYMSADESILTEVKQLKNFGLKLKWWRMDKSERLKEESHDVGETFDQLETKFEPKDAYRKHGLKEKN